MSHSPSQIRNQLNANAAEIAELERRVQQGTATTQDRNRLQTVRQAQLYWQNEYRKLTGQSIADPASPPKPRTPPSNPTPRRPSKPKPSPAPKENQDAVIVSVRGLVYARVGFGGYVRAHVGTRLPPGSAVKTGGGPSSYFEEDGWCEVRLTGGATVNLKPGSLMVIYHAEERRPKASPADVIISGTDLQEALDALAGR